MEEKIQAERVLEINAKHAIVETLNKVYAEDKELVKKFAKILYDQALLIEGLPIEDPVAFSNAVCEIMTK
jgi:molecular chaperone HtpG